MDDRHLLKNLKTTTSGIFSKFSGSFLNIMFFGVGFGQRIRFLKVDFSQLIVETFV